MRHASTNSVRLRRWGSAFVIGAAISGSLVFTAAPPAHADPVLPPLPTLDDLNAVLQYLPPIEIDARQRAAILAAVFDATGVLVQEVAGLVTGDLRSIDVETPDAAPDSTPPDSTPPLTTVPGIGGSRLPLDPGTFELTSGYGIRKNPTASGQQSHQGIDLAAPAGTPIYAVTGGTVVQAGNNGDGYGNLIRIKTGSTEVYYGHQIAGGITVKVGDTITAGQRIGAVGSTGNSTGNHLHFEVRRDGSSIDPTAYLATLGLNVARAAKD